MSIKDVIKNSIFESFGGGTGLSMGNISLTLLMAALIGIYIYSIYRFSAKLAFYSKDLNITIAGISVIVAAIMIAMQSNLIVSLGMVGALSIVRFRNAVKNPLDILYLFWSISGGIICGVGLKMLALILCIVMTALILLLQATPNMKTSSILVLRTTDNDIDWASIKKKISLYSKNVKERSRNIRSMETEVIFELTTHKADELVEELSKTTKLGEISLLSHDGEYRI